MPVEVNQISVPENKGVFWFQDSNGGRSGQSLPDLKALFSEPERWENSRKQIGVIQFHSFVFERLLDDVFIKDQVLPLLNREEIEIALNVVGANWSQCGNRSQIMYGEEKLISKINDLGGKVGYLTMQSTLSKEEGGNSETLNNCSPYPEEKRLEDIVRYVGYMKSKFPQIKIGFTDSDITKGNDYKNSLNNLKRRLKENELDIDYVFVDNSGAYFIRNNRSPQELKDLEKYVQGQLGWKFGVVFMADKRSAFSNKDFNDHILTALDRYNTVNPSPNYYLLTSWMSYPDRYLNVDAGDYSLTAILESFIDRVNAKTDQPSRQRIDILGRNGGVTGFGRATGWAYDNLNNKRTITVKFYLDGERNKGVYLGSAVANLSRNLVGRHGYSFQLPESVLDGREHELYVYAVNPSDNSEVALRNNPQVFSLSQ